MSTESQSAEKLSYAESVEKIEEILTQIETGELDIDALAPKVEIASELLRGCREILDETELRVTKAVEELEEQTEALNTDEE